MSARGWGGGVVDTARLPASRGSPRRSPPRRSSSAPRPSRRPRRAAPAGTSSRNRLGVRGDRLAPQDARRALARGRAAPAPASRRRRRAAALPRCPRGSPASTHVVGRARVERARVREVALLAADEEDDVELEALAAVERRERDDVARVLGLALDVHRQQVQEGRRARRSRRPLARLAPRERREHALDVRPALGRRARRRRAAASISALSADALARCARATSLGGRLLAEELPPRLARRSFASALQPSRAGARDVVERVDPLDRLPERPPARAAWSASFSSDVSPMPRGGVVDDAPQADLVGSG